MLSAQCVNEVANGMVCYYRYDDDSAASNGNLTFNDIWGYTDENGSEFAILGGYDSVYVFDVTDPATTVKVAVDDPPGNSIWRDFKVFDHYLYAVADQGTTGLRVYDLDSLSVGKLHLVGAYTDDFVRTHNIFIEEESSRLYVAGSNSSAVREGLLIYDLSSDAFAREPNLLKKFQFDTLVGNTTLNFYVHDIFVENDTAYCSHGYQGYYIWDLSDLQNLDSADLVGFMDNALATGGSYVHSSWNSADNDYAFVATEVSANPNNLRIYIVDQSDRSNPHVVNTWKEPLLEPGCFQDNNVPHNPFVTDGKLIISYYEDGVQVLDIQTDPENPTVLGYYDTEPENSSYHGTTANWGVYPFFASGTIVASDTKNGMFVMRLGDCPTDVTMSNEIINEDQSMISSDVIALDNVDVMAGAHLTLIAPEVTVGENCDVLGNGKLTIVNENRCGH